MSVFWDPRRWPSTADVGAWTAAALLTIGGVMLLVGVVAFTLLVRGVRRRRAGR